MNDLSKYLAEVGASLDHAPLESLERVLGVLQKARRAGRMVFVLGNGGSAATASHIVCDFAKNTRRRGAPLLRVVGLTDNIPSLTAYANDEGYEQVFAQQLESLIRPGDVVIGISTSGDSPNVLAAVQVARHHQATTIGFTAFDGGRLGALVDIEVRAPVSRVDVAEDLHLMYEHMITARLREAGGDDSLPLEIAGRLHRQTSESAIAPVEPAPTSLGTLEGLLLVAAACVGASSGSMILLDHDGKHLASALLHDGSVLHSARDGLSETLEHGLAGWVLQNRQAALIGNTLEDPRWLHRAWERSEARSRSVLSVPLSGEAGVRGVLTLGYPAADRFTQEDLELISALAARSRSLMVDQDSLVND
jgi:D-sedoheptulose 7-phosphate isomerase